MFFYSEATDEPTDPYLSYVSLLLEGDAANNSTNNEFVDSGPSGLAITRFGTTTQGSFSPFSRQNGAWSTYHPVRTSYFANSFFVNGTTSTGNIGENFTAEFWFKGSSSSAWSAVVGKTAWNTTSSDVWWSGVSHTGENVGKFFLGVYHSTNQVKLFFSTSRVDDDRWHHCAAVKQGTTYIIFVDGVLQSTEVFATALNSSTAYNVTVGGGTNNSTGGDYGRTNCHLSNVRITNTAVYTDSFTPSASPLTAITGTVLLVCQDNRLKDNGPNNYSCTVQQGTPTVSAYGPFADTNLVTTSELGSGYFNGTTDYLTLADNNDWTFAGDFTIDAWVYLETTTVTQAIVAHWPNNTTTNRSFLVQVTSTGKLSHLHGIGTSVIPTTGATTLIPNTWTHVAVSRTGTTVRLFVNGVVDATATVSGSYNDASGILYIGRGNALSSPSLKGHISNLRIVNGTALYTGNFSVPTSPTTAVANTKLLANFANAGAVDSAKNLILTTVGNAKISTEQSKFGGSSVSFDGTGDYLSSPASPQLDFGTGDFTIECWFYVAGNSPLDNMNRRIAALTATYPSSGTITGMGLFIMGDSTATGTGILFANYVSGTSWYFDYAGAIAQGVWHHVAVSRQGALMRLFLNGTIVASGNINNQSITNPNALTIGRTVYSGYTYDFNGYIDDFRITKGVARYTENFTPPDAL
jgi:hypothetical protein